MKILVVAFAALIAAPAQSASNDWALYVLEIRENVGCSNAQTTQVKYEWLYRGPDAAESYRVRRQQLTDDAQTRYSGYASGWTIGVAGGQPAMVAVGKRRVACRDFRGTLKYVDSYKFYTGKSREEIARRMDAELKGLRDVVGHEVVEWIDTETQIRKLNSGRFGGRVASWGVRG